MLLALLGSGVFLYVHTADFQRRVEALVQRQIQQNTGIRTDIGTFHFAFRPLGLTLHTVVLHGREAAGQPALATIRRIEIQIEITSLLHPGVKLRHVLIEGPEIHIYRLVDGATNLPAPAAGTTGPPAQPAFDLGIQTFDVMQGELQLQDRSIPLRIALQDLRLHLRYLGATSPHPPANSMAAAHFEGELGYGRSPIRYGSFLPAFQQADIRFSLWPNALRVDHLLLEGEDSRLESSFSVAPLTRPAIRGEYTLTLGLAPLTHVAQVKGITSGEGSVAGTFAWSQQQWNVNGELHAIHIRTARPLPQLGTWTASGRFEANQDGLILPGMELEGMGGRILTHGSYTGWKDLQLQGSVEGLELADLQPLLVTTGASAPFRTLGQQVESRIEGSFQMASAGPVRPNLTVGVNLTLTPRSSLPAGVIPVSGQIRGEAQPFRSFVRIDEGHLQLPGNELEATGMLRHQIGRLHFRFTSSNLGQLRPVANFFTTQPLQAAAGTGTVTGDLSGSLAAPVVKFDARLQNLNYGQYSADQLQAAGRLTPSALTLDHGLLMVKQQQLTVAGTIGLQRFQLQPASPLNLHLAARNFDIDFLQHLAGKNFPAGGRVQLNAVIGGTRADPSGNGHLQLSNAFWQQQKIRQAQADLHLAGHQITAQHVVIREGRSEITGSGSYRLTDDSYQVALTSPGIHLGDIVPLQSTRLRVVGIVRFTLQGTGTLQNPQGKLQISTSGLEGDGENLGQITATATAADHLLRIQATDIRQHGQMLLQTETRLNAPFPTNAHVRMTDFDIDAALRRFLPVKLTGHNLISGSAELQGPLEHPQDGTATIRLGPVRLALGGMNIRNDGPLQLTLANQKVTLQPARIVGDNTAFTVSGSADLKPPGGVLSGTIDGNINLALLHSFDSTVHSSGQVLVRASVEGALRAPQITGHASIQNGMLAQESLPIAFDHIEGQVNFQGNRVEIQRLTAAAGGGTLSMEGYAARTARGFSFDLSTKGQNLRVRDQGISATGNIDLRLTGQQDAALLSGNVQLTRISPTQNFDLAIFIANRRTAVSAPSPDSLLSHTRLDVHVVTGPQVELTTNIARLEMQADLRVRGTLANPVLLGRASASQGEILFAGNKYTVSKAEIQFANPFRIEPILDVGLTTTVQQYDVALNISGPVDKLNISYRSDPPLSSSDIVSLLATGQTQEARYSLSQESTTTFVGSSEQLLGKALSNVVASRVQRLFGITQIQVNPNIGGAANTGNGTVTIQQQVSRNLKLTYTQNLTTTSQDIIQIDWTINRHLGVTLSRDQFGLYGMLFHFRHRAR